MSTRYNTGNPIESTDVRDMSDNAKNFDDFANSKSNEFTDRFGVERKTIHGMNSQFDSHILNMGFTRVGTFATGATLTNPRQTLLWDIADGGDGQEYGWSGSFLPSGKIVPPNSTPSSTGGIAIGAWISRYDPALKDQLAQSIVYVRMYDTVWDGVVNNTDAIRAAHQAANLFNATVSYAGIKHYAIDANARIPVNTNVDFCGARAHLLNGIVQLPADWGVFNVTYLVEDPATPLTTATGAFTGSLAAGSVTPTKGLFNGDGYALVTTDYQIPHRDRIGTVNYEQSFHVVKDGIVSLPLSVDLSANAAALTVQYRKNTHPIVLSSPMLVPGGFNHQRFFEVARCNVAINGFTIDRNAPYTKIDTQHQLLFINYACCVYVNQLSGDCPDEMGIEGGSYLLAPYYVADLYVDSMVTVAEDYPATWPAMVAHHVNGLYMSRCTLSRIDVHGGAHNVYVDYCTLYDVGVQYGWGGGELKVTNSTFVNTPEGAGGGCVRNRGDYGGGFFGSITIDNITLMNEYTSRPAILGLSIGADSRVYMPGTISISNVHWSSNNWNRAGTNEMGIYLVRKEGTTGEIVAPSVVFIDGVRATPVFSFKMVLDFGNFIARPKVTTPNIIVRNIKADRLQTKGGGIVLTAGGDTTIRAHLDIADSTGILVNAEQSVCLRRVTITNCGVYAVDTLPSNSQSPQVVLTDCEYHYAPAGYTNPPLGGAPTGASGVSCTIIKGGVMYKNGFDLTHVQSCQGLVLLKSGFVFPLLPAGWTYDDLFFGKKTAYFN